MEQDILLKLSGISKIYNDRPVLRQFNLIVHKGECVALKGRVASGKSTLMKIAAGVIQPDLGEVEYSAPKIRIQYAPKPFEKHSHIRAFQFLRNMAEIDGYQRKEADEVCRNLFERYQMNGMERDKIRNLYIGEQKKLAVMQSLLKPSDLLLLDEPLSRLDPHAMQMLIEDIEKQKKANAGMILISHCEALERAVADRIITMEYGRIKEETVNECTYSIS